MAVGGTVCTVTPNQNRDRKGADGAGPNHCTPPMANKHPKV